MSEDKLPEEATADLMLAGPILRPWDTGLAVAELQELLCAHDFKLKVNGNFSYQTEDAVMKFQRQYGLRVDGIVGPQTWAVLKATVKPGKRFLRRNHTGEDVRMLQGLLQVNGYNVRRDGVFGKVTEQAVRDFQQKHKLKDDGIVSSITWTMLCGRFP